MALSILANHVQFANVLAIRYIVTAIKIHAWYCFLLEMEPIRNSDVNYSIADFTKEHLVSKDAPHLQFNEWFKQAKECTEILEPNTVALATCGSTGIPSVRMAHVEKVGPEGAVFYSKIASKKGSDLEENANAGAVFYWQPLQRQIRIEGTVKRLSDEEATKYFQALPRVMQISIWVNEKISCGSVIDNKGAVRSELKRLQEIYADESVTIPKPPGWGGYVIDPVRFEFWQGHSDWLDDRIVFTRENNSTWVVQQLAP